MLKSESFLNFELSYYVLFSDFMSYSFIKKKCNAVLCSEASCVTAFTTLFPFLFDLGDDLLSLHIACNTDNLTALSSVA